MQSAGWQRLTLPAMTLVVLSVATSCLAQAGGKIAIDLALPDGHPQVGVPPSHITAEPVTPGATGSVTATAPVITEIPVQPGVYQVSIDGRGKTYVRVREGQTSQTRFQLGDLPEGTGTGAAYGRATIAETSRRIEEAAKACNRGTYLFGIMELGRIEQQLQTQKASVDRVIDDLAKETGTPATAEQIQARLDQRIANQPLGDEGAGKEPTQDLQRTLRQYLKLIEIRQQLIADLAAADAARRQAPKWPESCGPLGPPSTATPPVGTAPGRTAAPPPATPSPGSAGDPPKKIAEPARDNDRTGMRPDVPQFRAEFAGYYYASAGKSSPDDILGGAEQIHPGHGWGIDARLDWRSLCLWDPDGTALLWTHYVAFTYGRFPFGPRGEFDSRQDANYWRAALGFGPTLVMARYTTAMLLLTPTLGVDTLGWRQTSRSASDEEHRSRFVGAGPAFGLEVEYAPNVVDASGWSDRIGFFGRAGASPLFGRVKESSTYGVSGDDQRVVLALSGQAGVSFAIAPQAQLQLGYGLQYYSKVGDATIASSGGSSGTNRFVHGPFVRASFAFGGPPMQVRY